MNIARAFFGWSILTLTAGGLSAASYFVTQSGTGSLVGTSLANAWSVAKYNASTAPTGGDTVFFSGTITTTVVPGSSGTGNGAGRLTLDFTSAVLPASAINYSKSFLTMLGGTISSSDGSGVIAINCISNSHDVTVNGFTFTSTSGLSEFMQIHSGCSQLTVSDNTVDNVESLVLAQGGLIQSLDIANNFTRTSVNMVDQTDILFLPDSQSVTIEGNKFIQQAPGANSGRHNDIIQTFKSGAGGSVSPGNWIIRYNWLELAVTSGSGDNSWTMLENMAGQPALKEYGNVFVGTGASLPGGNGNVAHFGTNATDTYYVYNNTFYRHQLPINAIRLGAGDGPGTLFASNNIGAADATCGCTMLQWTFSVGATWNRNYFFNFDGCSAAITGGNGSCNTNPMFSSAAANDFSTQSGSLLRGAGDSTIGLEYNQGIAPGAKWPNPALVTRTSAAWDVGAFQQGISVSLPTPPVSISLLVE